MIDKLEEAVEEINRLAMTPPLPPLPKLDIPHAGAVSTEAFNTLSSKLAEAIEEAAQSQFNAAQQNLAQAKAFAENLREEIKRQTELMVDLSKRLQQFGETMITAHERFHNDKAPSDR